MSQNRANRQQDRCIRGVIRQLSDELMGFMSRISVYLVSSEIRIFYHFIHDHIKISETVSVTLLYSCYCLIKFTC